MLSQESTKMSNLVCRTCFKVVENKSQCLYLTKTGEPQDSVDMKAKLEACVPELKLDRVNNSVICQLCVIVLNTAYDFKSKAVEIETKISRYMTDATVEKIDLNTSTKSVIDALTVEDEVNVFLPSNNSVKCLTCKKWFSAEVFQTHVKEHLNEMHCSKCTFRSPSRRDYEEHLKTHTSSIASEMLKCKLCNFTTPQSLVFRRHMKKHSKQLKCNYCSFVTSSIFTFEMHSKLHEKKIMRKQQNALKNKKKVVITGDTYNFSKEQVAYIYNNGDVEDLLKIPEEADDLKNYIVSAEEIVKTLQQSEATVYIKETRTYSCTVCDATYKYKHLLNKHLVEHNRDGYKCDQCEFTHRKLANYKLHMATHTGEIIYNCDKCKYRTTDVKYFSKHKQIHKTTLNCLHCNFETATQEEMNSHVLNHLEMSSLLHCDECLFETDDEKTMKEHADMHSFMNNSIHQHFFPIEFVN